MRQESTKLVHRKKTSAKNKMYQVKQFIAEHAVAYFNMIYTFPSMIFRCNLFSVRNEVIHIARDTQYLQ